MERQPCQAPFDGGFARRASPFAPRRQAPLLAAPRGVRDAAHAPLRRPVGRERRAAAGFGVRRQTDRHGRGPRAVGGGQAGVGWGDFKSLLRHWHGVINRLQGRDFGGGAGAGDFVRRDLRFAAGGGPVVCGADFDGVGGVWTVGLRLSVIESENEGPGRRLPAGRHGRQGQENAEEDMGHDARIGRPRHRACDHALDPGRRQRSLGASVGRRGGLGIPR